MVEKLHDRHRCHFRSLIHDTIVITVCVRERITKCTFDCANCLRAKYIRVQLQLLFSCHRNKECVK